MTSKAHVKRMLHPRHLQTSPGDLITSGSKLKRTSWQWCPNCTEAGGLLPGESSVTPCKVDLTNVIEKAKRDAGASSCIAWQIFDASIVQGFETSLHIALQLCHSLMFITLALQQWRFTTGPLPLSATKLLDSGGNDME